MKASGILFITDQGRALFLKRSASGDHPGEWCFAGGRMEEGEDLPNCAIREAFEETGQTVPINALREHTKSFTPTRPTPVLDTNMGAVADPTEREGVEFTTFITDAKEEFIPHLNGEHEAFAWAPVTSPPEPLHPGCRIALRRFSMNELDITKAIAAGELTSPQQYQNIHLWAMRITGTGRSYRDKLEEHVWRNPDIYMNDEMLDRLRAIPIIMEHPQGRTQLDSEEFNDRIVGTMQWPYLVPEAQEVWGITRIYDDATNLLLWQGQEDGRPLSTSPAVTLGLRSGSQKIRLEDGSPLLIEGIPTYIDHLAICQKGVWDKGGDPAGVQLNDSTGENSTMAEEKNDAEARNDADFGQKIDKFLECMDSFGARMDAMSARMDADDARRKDSEEKKDASEEKEEKKDSEITEQKTVADKSEEKEDSKEEEEKEDSKEEEKDDAEDKKDASMKEEEKEDSRADSVQLHSRLNRLEKAMPRQLTDEDYHSMIEAQSRADSAYGALGIGRAPIPLNGEDLNGYRRRVATKLKSHSKRWSKVNMYGLDGGAFDIAESDIFSDSMAAALSADDVPEGQLRSIVRHDLAGRPITEYVGEPSAWMSQFGGFKRRLSGIRNERSY